MRVHGRIEIGPFAGGSKSARQHQAFLVTTDGERLLLRRYDGPAMRDPVLEAMDGKEVVADGMQRDRVFLAKTLQPAPTATAPDPTAPDQETAPATSRGKAKRRS
jgi:hypothetical protein